MVHLLIVNVNIPVNAQIFFSGLLNLVTYNIVDLKKPVRELLRLDANEDVLINQNFESLGYESNFYLINISDLFIV